MMQSLATAALVVLTTSHLATSEELPKNFIMHGRPKPVAAINFEDSQGRARSLADFKGKVALLNIWATWCVSCRHEMPALDRLQESLGGADFEIVALSIDRGGIEVVANFYSKIGIHSLAMYINNSGKALRELDATGLPTTLIINRGGQELGRVIGPAEWDTPEIIELFKRIIAKPSKTVGDIALDERGQGTQKGSDATGVFARGVQWLKALFIR